MLSMLCVAGALCQAHSFVPCSQFLCIISSIGDGAESKARVPLKA